VNADASIHLTLGFFAGMAAMWLYGRYTRGA
jgi:hypothetical protein